MSGRPTDSGTSGAAGPGAAAARSLVLTLALQHAVPPFATDTYTPAFPRVTEDLGTSASLVGLTLTALRHRTAAPLTLVTGGDAARLMP